jgi:hypothetical protein
MPSHHRATRAVESLRWLNFQLEGEQQTCLQCESLLGPGEDRDLKCESPDPPSLRVEILRRFRLPPADGVLGWTGDHLAGDGQRSPGQRACDVCGRWTRGW